MRGFLILTAALACALTGTGCDPRQKKDARGGQAAVAAPQPSADAGSGSGAGSLSAMKVWLKANSLQQEFADRPGEVPIWWDRVLNTQGYWNGLPGIVVAPRLRPNALGSRPVLDFSNGAEQLYAARHDPLAKESFTVFAVLGASRQLERFRADPSRRERIWNLGVLGPVHVIIPMESGYLQAPLGFDPVSVRVAGAGERGPMLDGREAMLVILEVSRETGTGVPLLRLEASNGVRVEARGSIVENRFMPDWKPVQVSPSEDDWKGMKAIEPTYVGPTGEWSSLYPLAEDDARSYIGDKITFAGILDPETRAGVADYLRSKYGFSQPDAQAAAATRGSGALRAALRALDEP